jgi:hypothetical protein
MEAWGATFIKKEKNVYIYKYRYIIEGGGRGGPMVF